MRPATGVAAGRVELGQACDGDRPGEQVQLAVHHRAGAAREADVAVPRDRPQEDRDSGGIARVPARGHRERLERVDVGDVQPPRQQADESAARCRAQRDRVVVPEQRDSDRAGVEALCVRADDVPLDPAEATFEDLAVAVDEKVVADVVPAVSAHVVDLDRADDGRGLLPRIGVRTCGVMDDRVADRARIARRSAADQLVRTPCGSRHDRGRDRRSERARRGIADGAPHVVSAQAAHPAAQPVLNPVGSAGPVGIPELPPSTAGGLGGPRIGSILCLRGRSAPGAPAAAHAARAETDAARALPVQADEVEALRGGGRERAGARDRKIAGDERRLLGPRCGGQGEEDQNCQSQ